METESYWFIIDIRYNIIIISISTTDIATLTIDIEGLEGHYRTTQRQHIERQRSYVKRYMGRQTKTFVNTKGIWNRNR